MFQNPLNPQNSDKNDPFNEMGSVNIESQSLESNPYLNSQNVTIPDEPNNHFVSPHEVDGYNRQDGTYVESYWRDGDGNTSNDLSVADGGGYLQTNPDGSLYNNFGS